MAMAEEAHQVSISPTITKKLENATLRSGQFDFDLRGSDGSLIEVAQNDATGKVAFGRLEFYEPGEYDFTVSEETGNADDAVVYSDEVLGLHVSVRETPEGKLVATQSWTKDGVALVSEGTNASDVSPTITNEAVTLEVRVQKCSKDAPYEPLVNARYGLWRVNPSGNDIYMGNRLSGTDGYMSFDVPLEDGVAYYFKEESAPNGHLVDPYRTAYFTIAHEGGRFWMVYEADPAFATWAPDVK
jgi:pilin isopeptide linkage protein